MDKGEVEDLREELGALNLGNHNEDDHLAEDDEDMRDVGGEAVGLSVVVGDEQSREKPPTPTPTPRRVSIGVGTRDGDHHGGQDNGGHETKITYNYNYNYHYHYQCEAHQHNTVGGSEPLQGGGVGRRVGG